MSDCLRDSKITKDEITLTYAGFYHYRITSPGASETYDVDINMESTLTRKKLSSLGLPPAFCLVPSAKLSAGMGSKLGNDEFALISPVHCCPLQLQIFPKFATEWQEAGSFHEQYEVSEYNETYAIEGRFTALQMFSCMCRKNRKIPRGEAGPYSDCYDYDNRPTTPITVNITTDVSGSESRNAEQLIKFPNNEYYNDTPGELVISMNDGANALYFLPNGGDFPELQGATLITGEPNPHSFPDYVQVTLLPDGYRIGFLRSHGKQAVPTMTVTKNTIIPPLLVTPNDFKGRWTMGYEFRYYIPEEDRYQAIRIVKLNGSVPDVDLQIDGLGTGDLSASWDDSDSNAHESYELSVSVE